MSLGRSFALELGAAIPMTDQRLRKIHTQCSNMALTDLTYVGAIENENDLRIDTASDFMAQYTSRQEYRYTDPSRTTTIDEDGPHNESPGNEVQVSQRATSHTQLKGGSLPILAALKKLNHRIEHGEVVSLNNLRDVLRLAASLLCRSQEDHSAILHLFVSIPYAIFSKQSIKLGLSLWMGVVKENARLESRLLLEIIEHWITTTNSGLGVFDVHFRHV